MTFEFETRDVEVRLKSRLFGQRKHDEDWGNWKWSVRAFDTKCTIWKRNEEFGGPSNVPIEPTRHIEITMTVFWIRLELTVCVPLRAALDGEQNGGGVLDD